jgi:hypothetical protein
MKYAFKFLLIIYILILIKTPSFANKIPEEYDNTKHFHDKSLIVSTGYGLIAYGIMNAKLSSDSPSLVNTSLKGPYYAKIEFARTPKNSISICYAYIDFSANWSDYYVKLLGDSVKNDVKIKMKVHSIIIRHNHHFQLIKNFDAYFGIGLGYRFGLKEYNQTNPRYLSINGNWNHTLLPLGFESTLGLRYYFDDQIGIYTEIGFAKSVFQGGISIKLR